MGGGCWGVGSLTHLLRNRVYIGEAVHKGAVYPGQHEAILSREPFEEVQARLDGNRSAYKKKTTIDSRNLLTGLIFDHLGYAMSPKTSRREGGRTYTYYVSQAAIQRAAPPESVVSPVSAAIIEDLVWRQVDRVIKAASIEQKAQANGESIDDPSVLIRRYVSRIEVHPTQTCISFDVSALKKDAGVGAKVLASRIASSTTDTEHVKRTETSLTVVVSTPFPRKDGGKTSISATQEEWTVAQQHIDPGLVKALARAHVWRGIIEDGEVTSIVELAAKMKIERKHLRRLLRLAFLAPDIQRAILAGRQPSMLTLTALVQADIPRNWEKQRRMLGLV